MADNYTLVKLEDTSFVQSAVQEQPGTTVGFVTHPHEVYCEATLPTEQVNTIGYDTVAQPLAFNIERLLGDGKAVGAAFVQYTDESNLLAGAMDFTVAVPGSNPFLGGSLTATVRLTIRQLYLLSDNLHLFDEARSKLQAAAAL